MRRTLVLTAMSLALGLAACGGGGGGGDTNAAAANSPTGAWSGTTTTGLQASLIVFPDGTSWGAYAGRGEVGFLQGAINGAVRDYSITSGTVVEGVASTKAQTKQTITSTFTAGGQTSTLNGKYDASFEQAPSLATVAGTYTGTSISAGTTVTVTAAGAVRGTGSGCSFTGSATPRTDGNAFNLTITLGAAPCAQPGVSFSGVGLYDPSIRSLVGITLNSTRSNVAYFIGTKP